MGDDESLGGTCTVLNDSTLDEINTCAGTVTTRLNESVFNEHFSPNLPTGQCNELNDHAYSERPSHATTVSTTSTSSKKAGRVIFSTELDHDYESSVHLGSDYVRGHDLAVDKMLLIADNMSKWRADTKSKLNSESLMNMTLCEALQSSNISRTVDILMANSAFKDCIAQYSMNSANKSMQELHHRKAGFVSYLMKKGLTEMTTFDWSSIFIEFVDKIPEVSMPLLRLLLGCDKKVQNINVLRNIIP